MSRFLRRYGVLFLLVSLFSVNGSGQILSSLKIDLDPGGKIYDIINIPAFDCYMIVGSFDSVNHIARKKLAFLDRSDLHLIEGPVWSNPIQSIDGDIYCAAYYFNVPMLMPLTENYHVYLGGNFNSLQVGGTTYTRNGIAKIRSTKLTTGTIPSAFAMQAWNPLLDIGPSPIDGVKKMDISNDTLFYLGDFTAINNGVGPTDDRLSGVSAVKVVNNTNLVMFNSIDATFGIEYIKWHKGKLYVSGTLISGLTSTAGALRRLNSDGSIDLAFDPAAFAPNSECGCPVGVGGDFAFMNDSTIIYQWTNAEFLSTHVLNLDPTPDPIYPIAGPSYKETGIETYKHYAYLVRNNSMDSPLAIIKPSLYSKAYGATTLPATGFNEEMNSTFSDINVSHIWILDNLLFVSDSTLLAVGNWNTIEYPRTGAAVYCLEPMDATNFIAPDTLVCSGQTITYSIPPVQYANGYIWEYTGLGADIGPTGAQNLSDTLTGISSNSITISFLQNFTPGQLKVTPFSNFNGQLVQSGALIPSNTISINIQSNPLPNVNAGLDAVLTCAHDTLTLYGYSDSAIVSYAWVYPSYFDNVIGQHDTISLPGSYIFSATNLLGCINYDTVLVALNKTQPTATLPPPPYELSCLNPVEDFLGSTATPNTILEWYQDSTTFFPNPISVNTIGTYYFRVTDTLNGCFKDTGIVVSNNITPPDINIIGYPSIGLPLETLTCDLDTLNLVCTSSTPNSTASWINADTTLFYGDAITISDDGIYHLFATNNNNGCTISLNIFIAEDNTLHQMTSPPDGLLNCSSDSLILSGSSTGAGAVLEWTGSTITPSTNPLTVYDAGWYYLSAENLTNGCKTIDSVLISQDNSITVFAGNDTLVCNNSTVPVNASYVGTISGINYLWSNGATNANTNFTAGTQPYAVVQITGDGGCVGTDTVYLNLPPIPVVNFEGFKPCDDGPSGQIVATPVSGIEPFTYSIDNGTDFQSSSVFGGLYFGDYPIIVRDSVNCEYNFTATIDENSSLPSPAFLFSTYNFETDTVVIIDVSNPPTDSTIWLFPTELIVLDNNPLSPMILLPDTGTFQITMQAYYGNCLVELSKLIYASPFDSLAATQYNLNGIKSIELYPNPTTGNFTVEVEFYKSQRAALVVQDMLANTYIFEEYDESFIITQDIYLDGTVIDGTYVLKIVSEFDSASITFILAR